MLAERDLLAPGPGGSHDGRGAYAVPPTPGIVLTVEADDEFSRGSRSKTRQSRRNMQHSPVHRSPSASRQLRQPSGVSRSQSVRAPRRPQSVEPAQRFRQRISSIPSDMGFASHQSLPLPGDEADVLRLRNFAVTDKGVINRGDSFRSKSRSAHSMVSIASGARTPNPVGEDSASEEVGVEAAVGGAEGGPPVSKGDRYRVLVLGPPDVGKTALISQFSTSEYICSYDNSQDEENEKCVSVILNSTESELVFLEHQFLGDPGLNFCRAYVPDAYLVVYSVTSKRSLQAAKEALRLIHRWEDVHGKALILVGNKTDLARHRVLSADDGRSLAVEECSKFIETSAGINHHVDELLVGILSQIRLKLSSVERLRAKRESVSLNSPNAVAKVRCSGCAGCKAKGLLKRILKKACSRSKSCDNLHVL